ncbi:MAG: hypothetical protein KatS3mg131_1426 [Candidatus Tectimicrobiota bacterium]|nr:MAG: hypothetical protein KatS3mg131_1426 [Candidatus Tectomicrobia bacterium]
MANDPSFRPKGALTFILIYLVLITLIWINAYLRLWFKG